jgi:rhodanese-related sulfurtransferase
MAAPGGERVTTIGQEKATNPLLKASNEDDFVARLLGGLGTYPSYFLELREVNRRGPFVYGKFPDLPTLDVAEARRLISDGAALVDARPVTEFGAGHIPGSLSNALRPQFSSWLGWLVERHRPLVFVLNLSQDRAELVRQCLTIAYENIAGELAGGIAAWEAEGLPLARIPVVHAPQVGRGAILDVRQQVEWEEGHIPGAVHVELGSLTSRLAEVPDGPMTTMCGHGERATTAASLLAAAGRFDVTVLQGGPEDLAAVTGQPLTS